MLFVVVVGVVIVVTVGCLFVSLLLVVFGVVVAVAVVVVVVDVAVAVVGGLAFRSAEHSFFCLTYSVFPPSCSRLVWKGAVILRI